VAGSLVGAAWTILHLRHVPWALDIHPVVPGLIAAVLPMLVRSKTIDMSEKALATFFPSRSAI
jgi:hypothetical protein